ncbi:MAG TPA: glutathione S-transferase [Solirubrobacteraceae bacterium]|nr:glutathione S-transferase [Solirubrobacteraceae bacterium]
MAPTITLHAVPPSHPCMTVAAALKHKGLEFERVDLPMTERIGLMEEIYGEGKSRVPAMLVDEEPVQGSRAILARLEELEPEPTLYPSEDVREAERWGDEQLQDLGRRLPWGAMYFRPESMGTFGGGEPLDGPGTDFAIKFVRATWRYHEITAARLHDDLAGLPAKVAHVEQLAADGVIGGEQPNAADFQIGATIRVLLPIGDLAPLLDGTAVKEIALRLFPSYPGGVPAGAYPAGWVPSAL